MHQLQRLPIPYLSDGGFGRFALRHVLPHEKTFARRCETHCEIYFEARYETPLEN